MKLYRRFPRYEQWETLFGAAGIHIQVLEGWAIIVLLFLATSRIFTVYIAKISLRIRWDLKILKMLKTILYKYIV